MLPLYGLLFLISSKELLYAPSHRQDSPYHCLYYTSCGALAGMRNGSMCTLSEIDLMTHHTMSGCSTMELHLAPVYSRDKNKIRHRQTNLVVHCIGKQHKMTEKHDMNANNAFETLIPALKTFLFEKTHLRSVSITKTSNNSEKRNVIELGLA